MCPAYLQFWCNDIQCKYAYKNGFHCYLCTFWNSLRHLSNQKLFWEKPLGGSSRPPLVSEGLRPTRIQKENFRNLSYDMTMTLPLKTIGKFGPPRNQLNDNHSKGNNESFPEMYFFIVIE